MSVLSIGSALLLEKDVALAPSYTDAYKAAGQGCTRDLTLRAVRQPGTRRKKGALGLPMTTHNDITHSPPDSGALPSWRCYWFENDTALCFRGSNSWRCWSPTLHYVWRIRGGMTQGEEPGKLGEILSR